MKKIFTLLTLLLSVVGGANSVWAQTYTNEATTVTWDFTGGSLGAGVASPSAAVLSSNSVFGSDLRLNSTTTGTCTKSDGTGSYTFTLLARGGSSSNGNNDARLPGRYIDFSFTPAKGLTFTPTSVSFDIVKWGTGDPQFFVDVIEGTSAAVQIANQQVLNKMSSGKMESFDTAPLSHTYDLTGNANVVATTDKVTLRIYIGKLADTKQVGLRNVVISGTVSGTPVVTTTYTITAATNDASLGTVSGTATVEENEEVTLTATPTAAGYFTKWQKNDADFAGNTVNPITVTAIADATYTAIFEAKKAITFAKGEGTGTVPSTAYVVGGEDYTIPETYSLYKAGATLTGWDDGSNTYAPGATISNVTTDIALTAVFTDNTVNLGDEATTVNWTFARSAGAPTISCENSETDYVQHTTISGTRFDAVMHINTIKDAFYSSTTGKVNNTSNVGCAQVNKGTQFTIPVVKGTVITYTATNGTPAAGNITFGGENGTVSGMVTTYTYTGATGTLNILAALSNLYPSGISVSYPALPVTITPAHDKTTYITPKALDFSGVAGLIAYVATDAKTASVTMTPVTTVPAGTPLLLVGTASTDYNVPVIASASAPATNYLQQGDGTTVFDGSTYNYILGSDGKFHQINSGTVATTKAYLHLDAAPSGARELSIIFDDETTGVNEVRGQKEEVRDEFYNLAGQRVAQPTKGLYIVNGKKVIVK